jgi:hypothetical protein
MKRSEMVKIMWNYIQQCEPDYDCYMDERATDNLLSIIENAGMLPPESEGKTLYGLLTDNRWDEE